MTTPTALEKHFSSFRENIIGNHQYFDSPFGRKEIVYADWTASGRAYGPMEDFIQNEILPFMANTHTGSTITGSRMSDSYEEAKTIVRHHVHADKDDVIIFCGSGMTGAVNKLQRILGLRLPERLLDYSSQDSLIIDESLRPVVFLSHMEHHSNQISWLETIATVELLEPDNDGGIDLDSFICQLEKCKDRKNKILAITACSNVTGIQTAYHAMAEIMHKYGGVCFVDFAASAPYVDIDMHPEWAGAHLDAIYFSPHKFLGGPGTAGVLIFNKKLYSNSVPDQPGGGTVVYSNPWKLHEYVQNIEQREDGGTPPILQGIRVGMCIRLKEQMGVENLLKREEELLKIVFNRLSKIRNLEILEGHVKKRLGIVSFVVRGAHHNLFVKMLNDRFGIQTRGGCSCAGTYGHKLLKVNKTTSYEILRQIRLGDLFCKPGWVRLSVHPTMSNQELEFILDAIERTVCHFDEWAADYFYESKSDEFLFKKKKVKVNRETECWFKASDWA